MIQPWTGYKLFGCMLVATLLVAGCGGEEKKQAATQFADEKEKKETFFSGSAPLLSSAEPLLSILPDPPTADDDLQTVLSGIDGPVSWKWERNGKTIEGAETSRLPKGTIARGDKIAAVAIAGSKEVRSEAVVANSPPRMLLVTLAPERIWKGADVTAVPRAVDADGDKVEFHYQWLINREEVPTGDTPVLKGDRLKRGDTITVKVTPVDGREQGKGYVARPTVVLNAPPRFVSVPPMSFQSHMYSYQAIAEDPDGDSLSYSLSAAPNGMTIDSRSGKVEWKLSTDTAGTHTVEVAVKDTEGLQVTQKFTLTIAIPSVEKPE